MWNGSHCSLLPMLKSPRMWTNRRSFHAAFATDRIRIVLSERTDTARNDWYSIAFVKSLAFHKFHIDMIRYPPCPTNDEEIRPVIQILSHPRSDNWKLPMTFRPIHSRGIAIESASRFRRDREPHWVDRLPCRSIRFLPGKGSDIREHLLACAHRLFRRWELAGIESNALQTRRDRRFATSRWKRPAKQRASWDRAIWNWERLESNWWRFGKGWCGRIFARASSNSRCIPRWWDRARRKCRAGVAALSSSTVKHKEQNRTNDWFSILHSNRGFSSWRSIGLLWIHSFICLHIRLHWKHCGDVNLLI